MPTQPLPFLYPALARDVVRSAGAAAADIFAQATPLLAGSIARDWSLTLGASLRGGGVSSLVVEASLNDGTAAVACAERRVSAHDDRRAVLVHGDIHDANALQAPGTVHRIAAGLFSRRIGFQPFGDLLLAEADRLNAAMACSCQAPARAADPGRPS